MNNEALDNFEVAKLAAVISGQLRRVDTETESSVPAHRIDMRKFQHNVVKAANPHQFNSYAQTSRFNNSDEAKMMEYLNREAMLKVPELHPLPNHQPPSPPPQPVIETQQRVDHNIAIANAQNINSQPSSNILNDKLNEEFLDTMKSIDNTLKLLYNSFDLYLHIDNNKTSKKKTIKKSSN
jgi:hypothetical protein